MTPTVIVKAVVWFAIIGAVLFVPAGTLDWLGAWIFIAEFVLIGFAQMIWMARNDEGLLKERMAGAFQKGQSIADKVFLSAMIAVWFGWMILMALDAKRWQVSHMPLALAVLGAALIPVGFYIIWLTFRANSFAAPVVRIQEERGQKVIDTGPYAVVRHPMYAGSLLYLAATPLLLGSWLGLAVMPLFVLLLSVRIFIEERTLREGLEGYGAYMVRVRYRLLPYVW